MAHTQRVGLEVRFQWGNQLLASHFLPPDEPRHLRVGPDFSVGGARDHELVTWSEGVAQVHLTRSMRGTLNGEALSQSSEALVLEPNDRLTVAMGAVEAHLFLSRAPRPVAAPLSETIDLTLANVVLASVFFASLLIITMINRSLGGDDLDDEASPTSTRLTHLLYQAPVEQKREVMNTPAPKGTAGKVGEKSPEKSTRVARAPELSSKARGQQLAEQIFGGKGARSIFGAPELGEQFRGVLGNVVSLAPGNGGLSLRDHGNGGGGDEPIGIGRLPTRGRGGPGPYGFGAVVPLSRKKVTDRFDTFDTPPTVIGSLDPELIRAVIHANRSQVRYCYESLLTRNPALAGKISVRFVINAEGAVAQSGVTQSSAGSEDLERCVSGRVKTWAFPRPKGGGVVVVTYPFVFKQSGQ